MVKKNKNTLVIVQRRSAIGRPARQRATLQALGLRKLGQRVMQPDNPAIRGMVAAVAHIVTIESGT